MVNELDNKWLAHLVRNKLRESKPVDFEGTLTEAGADKGVNYTSDVSGVKLTFTTAGGTKKIIPLMVKIIKGIGAELKLMYDFATNRSEIEVYVAILQQMEGLMEEFGDKRGALWAKFYGFLPYSVMVMEDLRDEDYFSVNKSAWLDLDYSLMALRSLGRYHAMSVILKSRGVIGADYTDRYSFGHNTILTQKLYQAPLSVLAKCMVNKRGAWSTVESSDILGKRVEQQVAGICEKMEKLYLNWDRKFGVLNHGDFRSSNILYKSTEYTNVPYAVKFVDYQSPHFNSFIWDVTYLLYVSVKPAVRRASANVLFKAYHQALTDNLKFYKWEGYVPTLEDVNNEAKRLYPVAFLYLTGLAPIVTTIREDGFESDKLLTHAPEEIYKEAIFTEERYVTAVVDDIKQFVKLNVI